MRMTTALVLAAVLAGACSERKSGEERETIPQKPGEAIDVAVPVGRDDPSTRETERLADDWRGLEIFRDVRPGPARQMEAVEVRFAPGGRESFEGLDPRRVDDAPVVVPLKGDVAGPSVLKTQVYLDRLHFSVGVLDGRWGRNTAIALWWYQRSRGIAAQEPGALDEATFRALTAESGRAASVVEHIVTAEDVDGPFTSIPEDVYEQEKLSCLCYETKVEQLAERFHTTPEFLEWLNPGVDLPGVQAGQALRVPNVRPPWPEEDQRHDIARVVVSIRGNTFNAFDAAGNLVLHAPTTLGSKYDPSPRERLKVVAVTFAPHFHYQPTLFADVPDDEPEANLSPGPNSPVGVVWIALSKPHYGIHGTSGPDAIGYASSHGCVRLTNWDAREIGRRIAKGVEVEFLDTRG